MPGPAIVGDLRDLLGRELVVTDPDRLAGLSRDASALTAAEIPLAAVFPTTEEEVQAVMRLATTHGVPVVPQGALTGLSGGANTRAGWVALSLRRMDRILELDVEERIAVVEPGVTNTALTEAAWDSGLDYRPDPDSWQESTIGGNIATNAGGPCCVKYGATLRWLRGLRVVLADGRVMQVGGRTVRQAGLGLTGLFVGSEGTLGVVTQATLGLVPPAGEPRTVVASFPDVPAACAAVGAIRRAGLTPSLFEVLDRTVLRAVEAYGRLGLPDEVGAALVLQSDLGGASGIAEIDYLSDLCAIAGAKHVVTGETRQDSERLLQARRLATPALEAMGTTLVGDVCVPVAGIADLVEAARAAGESAGVTVGMIGHAGDGTLHPMVVFDGSDPHQVATAGRVLETVGRRALELGGAVTGEHGVGLLKSDLVGEELDPVSLELQLGIKRLLDPLGLMNPGKMWGEVPTVAESSPP